MPTIEYQPVYFFPPKRCETDRLIDFECENDATVNMVIRDDHGGIRSRHVCYDCLMRYVEMYNK
jgi:hypothetical protein